MTTQTIIYGIQRADYSADYSVHYDNPDWDFEGDVFYTTRDLAEAALEKHRAIELRAHDKEEANRRDFYDRGKAEYEVLRAAGFRPDQEYFKFIENEFKSDYRIQETILISPDESEAEAGI